MITNQDTLYTKLPLMPLLDDKLGHTFSVLTQFGNIIAKFKMFIGSSDN